MSTQEIADCPKCGRRDFIQTKDDQWVCLSCKFSESTPDPRPESESDLSLAQILLAALITALLLFAMLSV